MVTIPESVRQLIEEGHLAHLATVNKDGSPQMSGVWIGIDGDELVSGHEGNHQKLKNVRRDPRVVLSVDTGRKGVGGLSEYLIVYGRATITEGGAPELLQRLAHVYLGPGVKFPPMENPRPGYIMRITPERFGGTGPWSARVPGAHNLKPA